MLRRSFLLLLAFVATLAASAQSCRTIPPDPIDGVVASPANHTVLFETLDVRVIEVSSQPHTAEKLHTHAMPAVMITDGFSTGSLTMEGEAPVMRKPPADKTPRVVFLPSQGIHHAENLGDTPFHAIRVELKHPGCRLAGEPLPALNATDAVTAAPLNFKVLLENADVRVLAETVPPHTREPMHTDAWPTVVYIYQSGPDAKAVPRLVAPEGLHSFENTGDGTYRAIRVELKMAGSH